MEIKVSSEPADSLNHEGLILGLFSDERPPRGYCGHLDWRLNGLLSKLISRNKITGSFMEKVLIVPNYKIPSSKILLIGLGKSTNLTYDKLYTAGSTIMQTCMEMKCYDLALDIHLIDGCVLEVSEMTRFVISGFFNFISLNQIQSNVSSLCVLGNESCLDEIMLGMHEFKVDVKNIATIDIVEAKK